MKINNILMFFLACTMITSCVYKRSLDSYWNEKTVTTKRKLLLHESKEGDTFMKEYRFKLYEKDEGNYWEKHGWLPIGTKLNIHSVSAYMIDESGEKVYVLGDVNGKKFRYLWMEELDANRNWKLTDPPWHE